jgi:hypothetical protein
MKQEFTSEHMGSMQLIAGNALRNHVDAAAWNVLKATLGIAPLPVGWTRGYAERSLSIRSRTGAFVLKVTLDKQIFVDRRMKNKSYKSDTVKCLSMEEACTVASIILSEALPVPSVSAELTPALQ